jgi:hypothetical protein
MMWREKMLTLKIALLAIGVTVTAFANTSSLAAACAGAPQSAVATTSCQPAGPSR